MHAAVTELFLILMLLMHVACRYLNNTGLMWESAEEFGALLVFAEHRYYGESRPYSGTELRHNMQYLTAEQAMADYAELLRELKSELHAEDSAVIGFGGSYGGMLAAWMRMKYPHVLAGSIAASAPIWAFTGEDPPVDPGAFAKIVTRDATPAGGASKACAGLAVFRFSAPLLHDNQQKTWLLGIIQQKLMIIQAVLGHILSALCSNMQLIDFTILCPVDVTA